VCATELAKSVCAAMVTDDQYIIHAYLMMPHRPEMAVYSRLWSTRNNVFERLHDKLMSKLRSKAYDNIHATKER